MIQFVRQDPMAPRVSGQEENLPAADRAANQRVRWRAKRGIDFMLGRIAQLLHLIKTASPDNAYCWYARFHSTADLIGKIDNLESA
jgi:hypothetical protein